MTKWLLGMEEGTLPTGFVLTFQVPLSHWFFSKVNKGSYQWSFWIVEKACLLSFVFRKKSYPKTGTDDQEMEKKSSKVHFIVHVLLVDMKNLLISGPLSTDWLKSLSKYEVLFKKMHFKMFVMSMFFLLRTHMMMKSWLTAAIDAIWYHRSLSTLVQAMAWHQFGAKPLLEPMVTYCYLDSYEQTLVKEKAKYNDFHLENTSENVFCKMSAILVRPQCARGPSVQGNHWSATQRANNTYFWCYVIVYLNNCLIKRYTSQWN